MLTQCGNDLSRANIMKQAANIKSLQLGVAGPGIMVNTSATDFHPFQQLQFAKFNGNNFEPFGEVIDTGT